MLAEPVRRHALLFVLIGIVIGSWVLITPQGGGPDEVSHLVRAGGLARGQSGRELGPDAAVFVLPDSYRVRDVTCWMFQPARSAACAGPQSTTGTEIEMATRAAGYPVWSHLYLGLASRLPGSNPLWWARAANAAAATGLVVAALASVRRHRLATASVLAACTPMAWFTFGIVNPSAVAIAGAVALWVGLVHRPDLGYLAAAGWAALALPRRDGLIWACVALVAGLLLSDARFVEWWRRLGRGPRVLFGSSTAAAVLWGLTNDSRVSRLVAFAPLLVLATELARAWWRRQRKTAGRAVVPTVLVAGGLVAAVVVVGARPGGWDPDLTARIVGETGANIVEAIGVLGWLDTTLPWLAIVAWIVVIGVLAGVSMIDRGDLVLLAAGIAVVTVSSAWLFELYQGNTTGTYWQGRYSLPLLVGVPIVLGAARVRPDIERRVTVSVIAAVLAVDNVALAAAARRFGVGVEGSYLPWRWDTYDAPVPTVLVLSVHLAATAALFVLLAPLPSRSQVATGLPGAR